MSKIVETTDVEVPVRVAYDQWTQFEEFPRFMPATSHRARVSLPIRTPADTRGQVPSRYLPWGTIAMGLLLSDARTDPTPGRWTGGYAAPQETPRGDPQLDAAVLIERVSKRFGDDIALDDVSVAVPQGTILGIIGPSGAGKTTLVRLMTGALTATDGEIRVMDEDPVRFKRHTRERIGYMNGSDSPV